MENLLKERLSHTLEKLTQPRVTAPGHIDLNLFASISPEVFEEQDAEMTCCDYHTHTCPNDNHKGQRQAQNHQLNSFSSYFTLTKETNLKNALSHLHQFRPIYPVLELVSPEQFTTICRLQGRQLIYEKFKPNLGKFLRSEFFSIVGMSSVLQKNHTKKTKTRNLNLNQQSVHRIAAVSRILVLVIQIFARFVLPKHENDGFKTPLDSTTDPKYFDSIVDALFGGFVNWDGQYFLHITSFGYTHPNTIAFFPLLPMLIGIPSRILHLFLFPIISIQSLSIVMCWIFNNFLFISTAQTIYQIAKLYKVDSRFERLVVYLYCFNPASIFFAAYYSESLFSWATFNCILCIYNKKLFRSISFAALGAITRSNGLLNFLIIFAFVLGEMLDALKNSDYYKNFPSHIVPLLIKKGFYFIPGILPFVLFQMFCKWKFCHPEPSEDVPEFCDASLSLPYTYIQKSNWEVGFLRYFQFKQIPNFALAFPTLYILGSECWKRFQQYRKRVFHKDFDEHRYKYLGDLGLIFHGLFLTFFCFFCVHVQISTRMIFSSCPYLYIFIAKHLHEEIRQLHDKKLIWLPYYTGISTWFGLYFIIGTIAFSLGYPWT